MDIKIKKFNSFHSKRRKKDPFSQTFIFLVHRYDKSTQSSSGVC